MQVSEIVLARGHENILSVHRTTLEITKVGHLTREGDCIIAVSADKALSELGSEFRQGIRRENSRITILIEAGGLVEKVYAYGSSKLILSDHIDMVVRKSCFISGRTLAIKADKAARDLSRNLVEKLRDPTQIVKITLSVEV